MYGFAQAPAPLIFLTLNADQCGGGHYSTMSTPTTSVAIESLPSLPLNLALARKRRGLTLEEIAQSTRIVPRYLQAIETEEFNKLPGGVYATSYIRQYARAIGFSETELLNHYQARQPQGPAPQLTLQQSSRPKTRLGESMGHLLGHLALKPRTQHTA